MTSVRKCFLVWTAAKSGVLQGPVWMDNGRDSEDYWFEKQLHILWRVPSPGKALWAFKLTSSIFYSLMYDNLFRACK